MNENTDAIILNDVTKLDTLVRTGLNGYARAMWYIRDRARTAQAYI